MVKSARYFEIQEERKNLPVWLKKEEFLQTLKENQMVMVAGDTGSGKTTQIPQFVLEAVVDEENPNPNPKRVVGCTQPRRVAAMSAARRVAKEMDVVLGEEVGCTVRFDDCSSSRTMVKYLTDGMLVREAMVDPLLKRYNVIILDEVQEKSLATYLLCGILKKALIRRPDLKLVIMMNSTAYAYKIRCCFYDHVPLIEVPSRLHPVEILYTREPVMDYLEAAISKVIQIHKCEPPGDVLVFLTGEEEIREACSRIIHKLGDQVNVVPLYSFLPPAMQQRIFDPTPHPVRKIVVSTIIAETSLSIDKIVYVVDSGFSMHKFYNPHTHVESLLVSPISKESANQRACRAGGTRPGKCFRLYTERNFNDLIELTVPEIYRSNLVTTILTLKRLGVDNLLSFDFMDPPYNGTLLEAFNDLNHLGAVDGEGNLTKIGEKMSLEV